MVCVRVHRADASVVEEGGSFKAEGRVKRKVASGQWKTQRAYLLYDSRLLGSSHRFHREFEPPSHEGISISHGWTLANSEPAGVAVDSASGSMLRAVNHLLVIFQTVELSGLFIPTRASPMHDAPPHSVRHRFPCRIAGHFGHSLAPAGDPGAIRLRTHIKSFRLLPANVRARLLPTSRMTGRLRLGQIGNEAIGQIPKPAENHHFRKTHTCSCKVP
jgi:hypothetical protein